MVTGSDAPILGFRALLGALLALGLQTAAEGRKLRFVNMIYRHGDRSPTNTFPTNPYAAKDWPQGFGQLSQVGMRQHYELGQYLRRRYTNFLNSSYDRQEIYVRSTDIDRTLMSAESDLAGLYPPQGRQTFYPGINWQPIPVHTVPKEAEKLLMYPLKHCPRFEELTKETQTCPEFMKTTVENQEFLNMLAGKTGIPCEQISVMYVWMIYDILLCEQTHNFTLPAWVTPQVMERMKKLMNFAIQSQFGLYMLEEKSRLQGGVLLKQILQNITQAMNASTSTPRLKMIMYSAHDTTIAALQMALNVYSLAPPYAACHIFELYQENDGSFTVEMYYRNESTSEAHLLTLPSCTKSCPVSTFIQLTKRVIPENWEKECRARHGRITIELILGLVVGSCLLLLIIALSVKLRYRNKAQPLGYQQLASDIEESGKLALT